MPADFETSTTSWIVCVVCSCSRQRRGRKWKGGDGGVEVCCPFGVVFEMSCFKIVCLDGSCGRLSGLSERLFFEEGKRD